MQEIDALSPVCVSSTNSEEDPECITPSSKTGKAPIHSNGSGMNQPSPCDAKAAERTSSRKQWKKDFKASDIISSGEEEEEEKLTERNEGRF